MADLKLTVPTEVVQAAVKSAVRGIELDIERIRAEERERILGTPDEPTGILDRYEIKAVVNDAGKPLVFSMCARCPEALVTARDLDGDQTGVTLAEIAEQVMRHEEEAHGDDAAVNA